MFNVINQTNKRGEKKKGVTDKDVDLVPSLLDRMHEKNEVIMVNQLGSSTGKENSLEDQPSYLVQEATSDDKKKLTEYTTTMEDQLTSQNRSAFLPTEQKEQSKVVTDNATSGDDQSTSSDELTSPDERSLSSTLAVTYKHLSFPLKCCLLYLGLFPRLYEIPIRRLLQLWLAEGQVTQPTGETKPPKPLEELAKDCFEELLGTRMIEKSEVRLDGSTKTCCVTNALYDTLLLNAEKVGFFHIHRSSGTSQSPRLAEHLDMYIHTKSSEISIKHLRSYIPFYKKKGDAPTSGVSELLKTIVKGGFESLVVLDLEGVYKPVLSEMVGKLRQLKYLGLRRTLLDSVPESVGGLPDLETLDIKQTYVVTLPSTIWEAKKLRHLHMSEIYFDVKKSTRGSLKSHQTLWGLIIRRKLRETDWLVNLTGLRKLKLTCLEPSMEDIADWLTELSNLQALKLRSISDSNEPARLAIKAMRNLTNLSRLYLLGELPNTFKVSDLPENLEVLTLSVSHQSEDPMEALGKLGKLEVLKLYAHSFKGQNMTCHRDGFPQLQVLKLWMLKELQSWTVKDKAMPILKEIEIRCCKNLEKVDGLKNLTSLKELTLTNMKSSFIEYAREKVGDKVIENDWKFPPPWDTRARAES
ncbi:inactive disease susceptibility protein LOV1-like [Herrania umbratica]|uniref:Inactive disease susceptibility protein LOV1-like n=1 Tax=Herrania umbratica TaxID=108875 RepID=A0A6J1A6L1_9ROSI|nr:inactive disease susceptibility protein LOV1-like [Herrania umbratica]